MIGSTEFSQLWETETRWLMAPGLLTDIVLFLGGRSLSARLTGHSEASIAVPLPKVWDFATSQPVGVETLIPPELRTRFLGRCDLILLSRGGLLEALRGMFLGRKATVLTVAQMNAFLARGEREIEHGGGLALWQEAACAFGLRWDALPSPAGIVITSGPGA